MNRIILITIIFLNSFDLAQAKQIVDPLDISAVPQVFRPNDAQGVALGLTGVAYREGLFASYTNPAGLIFDDYEVGFSHIPPIKNNGDNVFNQEAINVGIPIKRNFSISAQFYNINFGETTVYYITDGRKETKKSGLAELQLSFAKRYILKSNEFSIGATCKYLNYYNPGMHSDSYLFDFGFRYRRIGHKWYSFGASISNIGKDLIFEEYIMDRPVKLARVGLSFGNNELKLTRGIGFLSTIEYQKSINVEEIEWNQLGIGLEIIFFNSIFTRIGHSFNFLNLNEREKIEGLTYGFGVITPKPINLICPFYLSLEYGRGLFDYREFEKDIFSILLIFSE